MVHILFLKPDPGKDHWINRLTAVVGGVVHQSPGFCHVELSVPHGADYVNTSIYQGVHVNLSCNLFESPLL